MCTSGFMMNLSAIPLGILLLLQAHYKFHLNWHEAWIQALVLTAAVIIIGTLLLFGGMFFLKRRRKPH